MNRRAGRLVVGFVLLILLAGIALGQPWQTSRDHEEWVRGTPISYDQSPAPDNVLTVHLAGVSDCQKDARMRVESVGNQLQVFAEIREVTRELRQGLTWSGRWCTLALPICGPPATLRLHFPIAAEVTVIDGSTGKAIPPTARSTNADGCP